MDADLFDEWFRIADRDRDGKVSGAEAVEFFQKSGLSKETLFEVWKMVAGNKSALTKPQFFGTLRLIALAQRSGGRLNPKEAQSTLIGVGPSLPPPEMAGLEHTRRPQVAQLVDSAPAAGAGAVPGGAQRAPSAAADSGSYLPMSQEVLAGVQAEFAALDGDRDGYVQGKECFELFIKSGLPKEGLWAIWNVVAGTAGQLDQQQFLQARYLMDNAKKGIAPPAKLPTGTFPPIAYGAGQTPSGYTDSNSTFAPDYTSQQIPMPELPGRQRYQEPSRKGYEPQGPSLDEGLMQTLPASERNRLQTERSAIVTTEQQLQKMRQEQDSAKQKAQFYEGALRELLLFRSKTSTALLQLQERFDKEVAEANSLEAQYEHDYSSVQSNYTEGRNTMLEFSRAKARKLETQTKLAELRKDIEQMGKITPEEVAMEDKQTVQLQQEVAAAEVKRSALEVRVRAVIEERAKMERELETLRTALAEGQTGMTAAQADLKALQATMAENPKQGADELQKMLRSATVMWKQLARAATLARVPIPPEAAMTPSPAAAAATANGNAPDAATPGPGPLVWDEFAAANAADWDDFKDEGFVIVNALPDQNQTAGPESDDMFTDDANSGESSTFHAERGHDRDTAVSALSNGSLDLDLMQSKGTVSDRLGPDRLVNWEAF